MVADCVFCKIINRQLPSDIITETKELIVVKDIAPKATIHYLIIPKKHISDISALEAADQQLAGSAILMAKELGQKLVGSKDFRLISNNGVGAGQCVFH